MPKSSSQRQQEYRSRMQEGGARAINLMLSEPAAESLHRLYRWSVDKVKAPLAQKEIIEWLLLEADASVRRHLTEDADRYSDPGPVRFHVKKPKIVTKLPMKPFKKKSKLRRRDV